MLSAGMPGGLLFNLLATFTAVFSSSWSSISSIDDYEDRFLPFSVVNKHDWLP
jgi:hypothetical protein